ALVLALLFRVCLGSGVTCRSSMEDSVTQTQRSESALERESVSLDCTYETSLSDYFLYWYKQPPRGSLIFLLWQHSAGAKKNEAGERFSVNFQKDKSSISLRITALELGDAATYFCAFSRG
uniref:Ig-like domain-containing protein n=1 Tax=Pelodiscus sinensis TaxID=13735 RepID=K7FAN4_PELSI